MDAANKSTQIHALPLEILIYIFRLATSTPLCRIDEDCMYRAFSRPLWSFRWQDQKITTIWKDRLSLLLVCRRWREAARDVVYMDLVVGKAFTPLLQTFGQSERAFPGQGYGRSARRLILSSPEPQLVPCSISELLRWCPSVYYLAKVDDDLTAAPSSDVDLSSIQRFDWVYARSRHPWSAFKGLDFLRAVVGRARNLRYLAICIRHPNSRIPKNIAFLSVSSHSLRTLYVQHIGRKLRSELESWNLPNLVHLVTDSSLVEEFVSPLFGPRIEVVEFLHDERLFAGCALKVLRSCPNLRELNYCVEFARFPEEAFVHRSLECVRLRRGRNYLLNTDASWENLQSHFTVLSGPAFPNLKRVVICGHWGQYASDERFGWLCDRVRTRGREVIEENPV